MSGLSARDLAGIQSCLAGFRPETVTVTRTGKAYPARVDDTGRDYHLDGMPRVLTQSRIEVTTATNADIRAFDELTWAQGTLLAINGDESRSWATQLVTTAIRSRPMTVASTTRDSTVVADIAHTSGPAPHLTRLQLRCLGDYLFLPASTEFADDEFGASIGSVFMLLANWPAPGDFANPANAAEDYPVAKSDVITTPDGKSYDVVGVKLYRPDYMTIFVQVPQNA